MSCGVPFAPLRVRSYLSDVVVGAGGPSGPHDVVVGTRVGGTHSRKQSYPEGTGDDRQPDRLTHGLTSSLALDVEAS